MHSLARRRATGYLLDCAGYLGIAAALVPVGLVVNRSSDLGASRSSVYAISALPPAVATVIAARAEAGPHRATWGKRRQGLHVEPVDGTGAIPLSRAVLRNTVKIFVPWQLGHMTTVGGMFGGFQDRDPVTYASTVLAYGTIALFAVTGLRASGRGPHDLAAGTVVGLSAPARPRRSR